MKNRSKGFTLIELIGVIVIIALLALIITPVVNNTVSSSKTKLYKNTLKNIELSAKDWFIDDDNVEKLPNNVENCYINLSELKNEGLVDKDIKNPKTGQLLDDSLINVIVTKKGKSFEFKVVDDGSYSGGLCTEYAPNILAPTINATTFNDYRKSFSLNITYDNLTTTNGNTFQYYLSKSSNSLTGGSWTNYTNNSAQTIGSGLTGTYYVFVKRLNNVVDGQNNQSTMGGVLIKIGNETYHRFGPYRFDNTVPTWSFYQKTNNNNSLADALENMNYAFKENTVTITFRGTDDNYNSNSLNINNITIKIGTENLNSTANKSLSAAKTLGNGVEYTLTLSNMTQKGELSLVIPASTLTDKAGNVNASTTINTKIKVNMCKYSNNTTWNYTAVKQDTFTVPCDGTYYIEVYGAQGGGNDSAGAGGKGAKLTGNIVLKRNTILYTYVGGAGSQPSGGFNGGGTSTGVPSTYGGGGASDIRVGGTGYANRIIVAGGGGGGSNCFGDSCSFSAAGGAGGAVNGAQAGTVSREFCNAPSNCDSLCIYGEQGAVAEESDCCYTNDFSTSNVKTCIGRFAQGGTQTAGGAYGATMHFNSYKGAWSGYSGKFGEGGDGVAAGAGGGGWYGGAGGTATPNELLAGAGGSSCISTNENTSYNCKNNSFLFTNITATTGANSGNGKIVIKLIAG